VSLHDSIVSEIANPTTRSVFGGQSVTYSPPSGDDVACTAIAIGPETTVVETYPDGRRVRQMRELVLSTDDLTDVSTHGTFTIDSVEYAVVSDSDGKGPVVNASQHVLWIERVSVSEFSRQHYRRD